MKTNWPKFREKMRAIPGYSSWEAMKARCFNPHNTAYRHYGGRGITVCDEWKNNFHAFLDFVGPRPSKKHWLDRIDGNGNYEPGNVRWALPGKGGRPRKYQAIENFSDAELLAEIERRRLNGATS